MIPRGVSAHTERVESEENASGPWAHEEMDLPSK